MAAFILAVTFSINFLQICRACLLQRQRPEHLIGFARFWRHERRQTTRRRPPQADRASRQARELATAYASHARQVPGAWRRQVAESRGGRGFKRLKQPGASQLVLGGCQVGRFWQNLRQNKGFTRCLKILHRGEAASPAITRRS